MNCQCNTIAANRLIAPQDRDGLLLVVLSKVPGRHRRLVGPETEALFAGFLFRLGVFG